MDRLATAITLGAALYVSCMLLVITHLLESIRDELRKLPK